MNNTEKQRLIGHFLMLSLTLAPMGCEDGHKKVIQEQYEAQREIQKAERGVQEQIADSAKEISKAQIDGDPVKVETKKIEATKDIAAAMRSVDEQKVEGSQEILEAQKKAGEVTGTYEKK